MIKFSRTTKLSPYGIQEKEQVMAKVASQIFKDPHKAEAALKELLASGFKKQDISIVARNKDLVAKLAGTKAVDSVQHPQTGALAVAGPLAGVVKQSKDGELAGAMAQALGVSEERARYYEFGISIGSVLVSISAGDQQIGQARRILESAEASPVAAAVKESSPGFLQAERMSGTNPIDAPLSGDFRKY